MVGKLLIAHTVLSLGYTVSIHQIDIKSVSRVYIMLVLEASIGSTLSHKLARRAYTYLYHISGHIAYSFNWLDLQSGIFLAPVLKYLALCQGKKVDELPVQLKACSLCKAELITVERNVKQITGRLGIRLIFRNRGSTVSHKESI